MQIYEITHRPVNEVLGTMAAGVGKALANKFVSSQLPGVSLYGDDDDTAVKPVAKTTTGSQKTTTPNFGQQQTGYASVNMNAPTGTALPATQTQPTTTATSTAKPPGFNAGNVMKLPGMEKYGNNSTPAAPTWQGTNINVPAVQRKQAAQAAASATAPTTVPATTPATAPSATTTSPAPSVSPRPGYRIVVTVPAGGKYYKTDKGWTNEIGQAITKPISVAALEKRADTSGREERLMPAKTTPPVRQRKRR